MMRVVTLSISASKFEAYRDAVNADRGMGDAIKNKLGARFIHVLAVLLAAKAGTSKGRNK